MSIGIDIVSKRYVAKQNTPLLRGDPPIYRTASRLSGVFNLSCTIVGAGVMGLPAAIKVLGIIPGLLMILISGFLSKHSIDILLRYSEDGRASSYGKLMKDAFGSPGETMVQVCVIMNNIGVCSIYLIIIADVISGSTVSGVHHSGVLEELFGEVWWTGRAFVLVSLTVFVLIPTARIKRMESLQYTSGVAVGLAVFFIIIVVEIAVYKMALGLITIPALFPCIDDLASFWNLFTAFPVLICAYLCHYNVHGIQKELRDPTEMHAVVKSSLSVCGFIYILTGLFGFLLFGDATATDVLSNFDSDLGIPYSNVYNVLVQLSYAIHIVLVFPVIFYSLRSNFDELVYNSSVDPLELDNRRFAVITMGSISVILSAALFIPNIWAAFQFTGATAGALILFIFPAAIVLKDRPRIASRTDKILSWGLIILAVLSDLVAIYSNVASLL